MKTIVKSLLTGLAIVLPLIITIELLRWLLQLVEYSLAPLLQLVPARHGDTGLYAAVYCYWLQHALVGL